MGDIIYSLPAIKALGGGDLYLNINSFTLLNKTKYEFLKPLLMNQPYIHDVHLWNREQIDVDLDRFRYSGFNLSRKNLCEAHLEAFGLDPALSGDRWLYAKSNPHPYLPIIINRTFRYRCPQFCYAPYANFGAFVGLPDEHSDFVQRWGQIEHIKVNDALELAELIHGAELFVGNQSLAFAISEGLHVNNLLEESPHLKNCNFKRR